MYVHCINRVGKQTIKCVDEICLTKTFAEFFMKIQAKVFKSLFRKKEQLQNIFNIFNLFTSLT